MELRKRLFTEGIWNFSALLIGRIGGVIFTILIARALLPESFGLYSLVTSLGLMFLTFFDYSINQALISNLSKNYNKKELASSVFKYIFKIKFVTTLILLIIFLILSYPLAYFLFKKPEIFPLLLIFSSYILFMSLESFFESLFYLQKKTMKFLLLKESFFHGLRFLLFLFIFYSIQKEMLLSSSILVLCITSFLTLLLVTYLSFKNFSFLAIAEKKEFDKKPILKLIFFTSISGFLTIFFAYLDTFFLGIFASNKSIGYYKAAYVLTMGIAGLFYVFNILLNHFSRMNGKRLDYFFNEVMRYFSLVSIPATFGLIALSKYVLVFVYGSSYLNAVDSLYILSPIIFFSSSVGIFYTLFSARGKPEIFSKIITSVILLNVLLNSFVLFLLRNRTQEIIILAIALSLLISWIAYFFICTNLIKNKLGIKLRYDLFIKPLIASSIMLFSLFLFHYFVSDINILNGSIEVILGGLIYFMAIYFMKGIDKRDFDLIRNLFNRNTRVP